MKVRILQPFSESAYFKGDIVEIKKNLELDILKKYNEIELVVPVVEVKSPVKKRYIK